MKIAISIFMLLIGCSKTPKKIEIIQVDKRLNKNAKEFSTRFECKIENGIQNLYLILLDAEIETPDTKEEVIYITKE